jgi:hypothetical protein
MSMEVVFEKEPAVVLQLLANAGINLQGHYLDNENNIFRIVVAQQDIPQTLGLIKLLGQNYTVSIPKNYTYVVGVPGQTAKLWQTPGIVASYNLEDGRTAAIYNDVYQK